jgi:cytochrome P450
MAGRFPNGPKTLPFIGSLLSARQDLVQFFVDMAGYGDLSFTQLGPARMYLVNHPDLVETMLMDQHRRVVKDNGTRIVSALVGQGLLTSDGDHWRHQRKLAAPPLQPKRIANYAKTMVECAQHMVRGFRNDEVRDLYEDMTQLTLEIAGKTLLGVDPRRDAEPIARCLDAFVHYFMRQLSTLEGRLPASVPTPSRRRLRTARAELDAVIYRIIDRCRRSDAEADHLLARLVRARDDDGQPMPDEQLRDEAVTMLLAGHETTALALTYTLYLLSQHPAAAARVRNEIDQQLAGAPPSAANLTKLPYLAAVVRESLRLYPPAFVFGREVVESFELGGYTIDKGSQVMISPYVSHRDPRFFDNPSKFEPERWLAPEIEQLPRFAYFPFGGGPRVCIGNHFALMETGLVLAVVLAEVELQSVPGFRMQLEPSVTLRPRNGFRVLVRRRATAAQRKRSVRPVQPARPANNGDGVPAGPAGASNASGRD